MAYGEIITTYDYMADPKATCYLSSRMARRESDPTNIALAKNEPLSSSVDKVLVSPPRTS